MYHLLKRKSGGQPGNQNARKKNFYSKVLTPEEKIMFKYIDGADGIDREFNILRIKLWLLLSRAETPQDLHLVNRTISTLGRLYKTMHSLGNNDISKLQKAFHNVFDEFALPPPPDPDAGSSLDSFASSPEKPDSSSPSGKDGA